MKEYMPGQGSYKVEEAGALTGIPTSYNVDTHWGTLVFDRDDVKVPARGLDIALSSRFNSDHLYSTIIPKVSKSDGPVGLSARPVPSTMMSLPADQTNFYRICNGWSWKLPYTLLGEPNAFKFSMGDGRIFDLASTITQEAWGGDANNGNGWHSWTEGYEVTYAPEYIDGQSNKVNPVTVVIPEIQVILKLNVLRSGTSPWDFTPQVSSLSAYLSDGKVISFTANGLIALMRDPANKNSLTFSYASEVLHGQITGSISRRSFSIQPADYALVELGDLVIIGDEMRVVFTKDGNNQISTSCNFDIAIPPAGSPVKYYTILKAKLQKIVHTDGRSVKFYRYTWAGNATLAIVLSSNSDYSSFAQGDQFLGLYTIGVTNQLVSYQTCDDKGHVAFSGDFAAELSAHQSDYVDILQTVSYEYYLTSDPTPDTDRITVTNNVGAPTIYYFQKGGFCSHSWNNAFFHRGACRRGGTKTSLIIERPDFYINPNNPGSTYGYVNINRIDDNAFWQVSKDDYQRDENAKEFNDELEFAEGMFRAQQGLAAAGSVLSSFSGPTGPISAALGAAGMALSATQYNHQQAKYARDARIARNAPPVSAWVPIAAVTSPNRLTLSSELTQASRQNDVFAVMNAAPDVQPRLTKTSHNGTRVYVDYTNGGNPFGVGDYIFLRTEFQKINATGTETWAGGASQKYVEVETAFQFLPDEGEVAAICRASNPAIPASPQFYGYYLNKPKVVRIELKDSPVVDSNYWKRIDYEYNYEVQGMQVSDNFEFGGFAAANVEGPYNNSFEFSDIALKSTTITTGISNIDEDIDLICDTSQFAYDVKNFHKGVSVESRIRRAEGSNDWLFVSKTVNVLGKPCSNANYYGVKASLRYEGGNTAIVDGGGASWRSKTDYRFDAYGRAVRTTVYSPFFEGRRSKSTWTQYVGSSSALALQAMPDLDPLDMFSDNYASGNYQDIFNTFNALGLVGATIEDVDSYGTYKKTYNAFDPATMNLLATDTVVVSSLRSYKALLSLNSPNFQAEHGATVVTDPSQIWWNIGGSDQNDWDSAEFDADDVWRHALTRFEYDATTNNLVKITKPLGNEINIAWGSSWKSSYIVLDYKTLDNNLGGGTQYVVTSYDYDLKGRLISKTVRFKTDTVDSDSNLVSYGTNAPKTKTEYTYDGMDRLRSKKLGDGSTQTLVLQVVYKDSNADDGVWANPYMVVTDYLGFRTKSLYDSRYRLVRTRKYKPNQDIAGTLDYDPSLEVLISSEQNIYDIATDKVAQNIRLTGFDEAANHQVVTGNTYDSIGRLIKVESKTTDSSYQGDSVFRTLKDISYDETANAVVTREYLDDSSGNYVQTRVENDWLGRGPVKEIAWTAVNGLGLRRTTVSHYRHDGKLVKKDLPNRKSYQYSYDNRGLLETIWYPDGTRAAMMYDLNGNLVQTIDRRNLSTTLAYNLSDMVVSKTTIDAVRGNTVVATTYTQFGPARVLKTEDGAAVVQNDFWYHLSGGVLTQQQTIDGHTVEIDKSFGAAGNLVGTTAIASGSSPATWTFTIRPQFHPSTPDTDHFNRIAVVDNTTTHTVVTLERDFLDLTKTIKYGQYSSLVGSVTHGYDKFLRLASIASNEGTPYLNVSLQRDLAGNITGHTEPALSPAPAIDYEYAYDGMNRLSSGEGSSHSYDELSNLLTQGAASYIYQDPSSPTGDQMRLATFKDNQGTSHACSYDANGNPTAISNQFSSLAYDNLNHLRQLVHSQTDNYWYNDAGLRVKKTEDAGGGWKTTYTLFEGDNPLLQEIYTAAGRIQTTYNVIVDGKILAQYKTIYPSTQSVVYFYLDNLGSRRVVVNSAGSAIDRIRYSAWGVATQDVGSDDLRSFTGKDYDASGLIYFNARYYDPTLGRFLTEDPSRKGGNWYGYCDSDPVNRIDPAGTQDRPVLKFLQSLFSPPAKSPLPPESVATPSGHAMDVGASAPIMYPPGQVERAEYLVQANIPYGHAAELAGRPVPLATQKADCLAAMSAATREPLMSVPQLIDPSQSGAYYAMVTGDRPGVWTAALYTEKGSSEVLQHVQLNVGGGRYFDSVPWTGQRGGPSYSTSYFVDYIEQHGGTIKQVAYLVPIR